MLDTSGNALVAVLSSDDLHASDVIADSQSPHVVMATLNLNTGVLLLSFSEVMDVRSCDGAKVWFDANTPASLVTSAVNL